MNGHVVRPWMARPVRDVPSAEAREAERKRRVLDAVGAGRVVADVAELAVEIGLPSWRVASTLQRLEQAGVLEVTWPSKHGPGRFVKR